MTLTTPNPRDWRLPLFAAYVTVIGAALRLTMPLNAPAPLNDGGLFYSIIRDIQQNGFALPLFTSYNQDKIPFVYPPLAFYFSALISTLFNWSVFDLLRLLPPILSALCIPAFYLLAKELLRSEAAVALSVAIYAILPRVFDWHIMGAGITRAPGMFFALLAMRQFYFVFTKRTDRSMLLAALFSTLAVYTHPEAAVHTVIAALFFYAAKDRSLKGLGRGALIAFSVVVLTAPWWLTAILRHGPLSLVAPFISARQDSHNLVYRIVSLLQFNFADEHFLSIWGVLSFLGLALLIARRQFFLPAWVAVDYLLEPRAGSLYLQVPAAMATAIILDTLILPAFRRGSSGQDPSMSDPAPAANRLKGMLEGRAVKVFLGFLFLYCFTSAIMVSFIIMRRYTLRPPDLDAFQWVRENTATSDQFVLLTGELYLRDPSSEWFPALTGRKNLTTVFGYEWVRAGSFKQRMLDYGALQDCSTEDAACLDDWSRDTGQSFDYIYIRKYVEDKLDIPALAIHLAQSPGYQQVYDTEGVVIFKRLAGAEP